MLLRMQYRELNEEEYENELRDMEEKMRINLYLIGVNG